MENIRKRILGARPKLRIVSPLAYWITFIFGIFNIILGATLYLALDQARFTASLLIVNDLFTFKFWGITFVALGILKLYALFINNWNLAKNSLLIGIAIKAGWAIALTVRTLVSPGTLFLDFIWLALAFIQISTYIFFMPQSLPPLRSESDDGR